MEKNKHYIKVFFTDNEEEFIYNLDGGVLGVATSIDSLREAIGTDIHEEMQLLSDTNGVFGYRIDYTLTPITEDIFK